MTWNTPPEIQKNGIRLIVRELIGESWDASTVADEFLQTEYFDPDRPWEENADALLEWLQQVREFTTPTSEYNAEDR
jgi:hypothetical protein